MQFSMGKKVGQVRKVLFSWSSYYKGVFCIIIKTHITEKIIGQNPLRIVVVTRPTLSQF